MTKTLRASVSFPPALHTAVKVAVATSRPPVTLIQFVSRVVERAQMVSDLDIAAASLAAISYRPGAPVRSTVMLAPKVARYVKSRAARLNMTQSEYIAAAVAHSLSRNHVEVDGKRYEVEVPDDDPRRA